MIYEYWFGTFIDQYLEDLKPQIKLNTYHTKVHIINTHIRPYFADKSLSEISSTDILQWQNELLSKRDKNDKEDAATYLRTVENQLSAIFNHAVRYYRLPENPCIRNKKMGKSKAIFTSVMIWKSMQKAMNILKQSWVVEQQGVSYEERRWFLPYHI